MKARILYAMAWLHLIRTSRFTFTLLNWGVIDFLWLSIFILGILSFSNPAEYHMIVPMVFWAIAAFNLMSTPVWTVGNWIKFYVNIGIFEEHELAGVNHTVFLSFRVLPSILVMAGSLPLAWLLLKSITGINPAHVLNPGLLALSLFCILIQATMYSLIIAYLSLYTQAPAPLLDFMNMLLFIIGGVATPVENLPGPLKVIALLTPYSHPAELLRYASVGKEPYLGVNIELVITVIYIVILSAATVLVSRAAIRKSLVYGVKGIGRT